MNTFVIDQKYSVGHHLLDWEHAKILTLCKALCQEQVPCRAELFNDLVEQTQKHFRGEESLLRARWYPHLREHSAKHEIYEEVVASALFEAGSNPCILKEVAPFLQYWWQEHLLQDDQQYVPWIEHRRAA